MNREVGVLSMTITAIINVDVELMQIPLKVIFKLINR